MKNKAHFPRAMVPASILCLTLLFALPAVAGYSEGMECYKQKDWPCVVSQFQPEVQAHPNYDFGWFMIGIGHLQSKEYDSAVTNLNKAIEINGGKLGYHVNKAKAYTDQQRYADVISSLAGKESLEGSQGEVFSLNYQLGTAYHRQAKHGEAVPYLEKSAAVKPDFTTLYMLGVSYDALGNVDKSLSNLKAALAQKPGDGDVQSVLANAYLGMAGREPSKSKKAQYYTEALKYAQGAAKASPKDHLRQNLVARAHLGAGDFGAAETAFKRVLSLKPSYCFAKVNLGKVYIAQQRWSDGAAILTEGTKCMPKSDVAWESLGFCQEKLYKNLKTDGAKISQLNKALSSFQTAAKFSDRASIQASIDRINQNIGIAQQNTAIAQRNIKTMEDNLAALRKTRQEFLAGVEKRDNARQFFLDKGQWPDEKEAEYKKEVEQDNKSIAILDKQIADQEAELAQARAALAA